MPARTGRGAGPGAGPSGSGSGGAGRAGRAPEQPSPTTRGTTRVEGPELAAGPAAAATFTSRALILLLVVAVLGVSYASSIRAWLNQRNEQRSLSSQIAGSAGGDRPAPGARPAGTTPPTSRTRRACGSAG